MSSNLSALRKQIRSYRGLDGSWDLTLGLIVRSARTISPSLLLIVITSHPGWSD